MPFVFIVVGITFIVAGFRSKASNLLTLVKGDLTGSNNFVYWMLSILVIGSLGYVGPLRPLSRALLILVIVVLLLKAGNPDNGGGGFFSQFQSALSKATKG